MARPFTREDLKAEGELDKKCRNNLWRRCVAEKVLSASDFASQITEINLHCGKFSPSEKDPDLIYLI